MNASAHSPSRMRIRRSLRSRGVGGRPPSPSGHASSPRRRRQRRSGGRGGPTGAGGAWVSWRPAGSAAAGGGPAVAPAGLGPFGAGATSGRSGGGDVAGTIEGGFRVRSRATSSSSLSGSDTPGASAPDGAPGASCVSDPARALRQNRRPRKSRASASLPSGNGREEGADVWMSSLTRSKIRRQQLSRSIKRRKCPRGNA